MALDGWREGAVLEGKSLGVLVGRDVGGFDSRWLAVIVGFPLSSRDAMGVLLWKPGRELAWGTVLKEGEEEEEEELG